MATYYVDPSGPNGSGTESSPFNTFASLSLSTGDTVLLKSGTTIREQFPAITVSNLTIASYGAGAKPIISGANVVTAWTSVGGNIFSWNSGSNNVGNVVLNGTPLQWRSWSGSLPATALQSGQFSFDPIAFVLYIYPPVDVGVSATIEVSVRDFCISQTATASGLLVNGLELKQATTHGTSLQNSANGRIANCRVRLCGGKKIPAYYYGNGIQIAEKCNNFIIENNDISDIYDSAITPQLFSVGADSINNVIIRNNRIRACGLAGIEISTQTANQSLSNVQCYGNVIDDIRSTSWFSLRTGNTTYGIGIANNGGTTAFNTSCIVHHNVITNAIRGVNISQSNGQNEWFGNVIKKCTIGIRVAQGLAAAMFDKVCANVVAECTDAFVTGGGSAMTIDLDNNVIAQNINGIVPGNGSAVVTARNNIITGNQTAFSGSVGTLTESYNNVSANATVGRTLDATDTTFNPIPYVTAEYELRIPPNTIAATLPLVNPLAITGTYVQGTMLANGRMRPGFVPVGAYMAVLPRTLRN
jgi:hypothetical protein